MTIIQFGQILLSLSVSGKMLIKKWKNVRDQYVKSVKRRKGKSGSAAKTTKNYIFHEQLSFLKGTVEMRETESSLDVDLENSPQGLDDTREDNEEVNEDTDVVEKPREVNKVKVFKGPSKRKKVDIEKEIMEHLSKEDRHLSFFKGLLPSVNEFSDDETLQFQSLVINAIQNIKKARQNTGQHPSFSYGPSYYPSHQAPSTALPPSVWNNCPSSHDGFPRNSPATFRSSVQPRSSTLASPTPSDFSDRSSVLDVDFADSSASTFHSFN